jgi:tetratricopeptide (TPR) repeat protein
MAAKTRDPWGRGYGRRRAVAIFAACAIIAMVDGTSPACGPFFPNQIIVDGDSRLLAMPVGDFTAEMNLLRPAGAAFKAVEPPEGPNQQTVFAFSATVDEQELRDALRLGGSDEPTTQKIVGQYAAVRQLITQHDQEVSDDREKYGQVNLPPLPKIDAAVPAGLPGEFGDYLRGLIASRNGDAGAARAAWKGLLARPAGDRHFRSTWAAFMLGKSQLTDNPDLARKWFAETRQLAGAGFADSLGLAESSLGWEAKAGLSTGNFSAAMKLYLQQMSAGDATASMSLRDSARSAFAAGPAALRALAGDAMGQRVITAYILADAGPFAELSDREKSLVPTWLAAVESAGVKNVAGADRLAWAAYRMGDFDAAGRWASRAPADSAVAQWVRSKLLLRDGKIDEAAAVLGKIAKAFPQADPFPKSVPDDMPEDLGDDRYVVDEGNDGPNVIPPIVGDLAVLQLSRRQYVDSLDLLLRADFWMDAAYIAERVLTPDELKEYVDRRFPLKADRVAATNRQPDVPYSICYLLARRLTRLGRWKEARGYYPADMQPVLDQYVAAIRAGHDKKRSDAERAESFMTAARIARKQGMELLGTELGPDYFCYAGNFTNAPDVFDKRGAHNRLAKPSDNELARVAASAPGDTRRFHYRYIAADYAWAAAQLMPDNNEQTAEVLYEAGCWLKDRDPKSALRFYNALITRCPSTSLGKQAAAKHWFPTPPDQK